MQRLNYTYEGDYGGKKKYYELLESVTESYFQQTLEWSKIINSFGTDKFVIVAVEEMGKFLGAIPCFVYRSKYGNIINSIPYPGPLGGVVVKKMNKKTRAKTFEKLMKGVDHLAKLEECLTATIISSPFWPNDELFKKYFKPHYQLENYTLCLDLNKEVNKTSSHFRNNLRRMLNNAENKNLQVFTSSKVKDVEEWYKIHEIRHVSLGLDPVPKEIFWGSIKYLLPKNKGKFFFVKNQSKKIIAGCLVCYHKKVLDTYMISGSESAYKNGAIYLLIDHLLSWARKKGFAYFNWQSSKPRGSGPYNFKMQWGSREAPYYFFTKVYKPIDKLLKLDLEIIKEAYKWHFLLPFNILSQNG